MGAKNESIVQMLIPLQEEYSKLWVKLQSILKKNERPLHILDLIKGWTDKWRKEIPEDAMRQLDIYLDDETEN